MSKDFISKTYQLVSQPYGREQVMHETVDQSECKLVWLFSHTVISLEYHL